LGRPESYERLKLPGNIQRQANPGKIIRKMINSGFMRSRKNVTIDIKDGSSEAYNPHYIVPAVDRAARILSLLRTEGREMTIAEIADATGWHKSSVHKLLVTLNYHGLLDRDALTKRYSLGVALSEYGRIALNNLDIRYAAKPFLKTLVECSGETAGLSILRGTKMIFVDIEEPQIQIRVSLFVGMRSPVTATSNGKAVLAWFPESRLNEIIQIEGLPATTKKSIVKPAAFRAELAATRERGYATDFEEFEEGVAGVSAPVFESSGQVMGAICVAMPAFRMRKDKIRRYGKKCAELASQLSSLLK
jgi:DNA-binding IclR family transcriptional regulator